MHKDMGISGSEGEYIVECDNCGDELNDGYYDFEEAIEAARENNWFYIDGDNFCTECADEAGYVCSACKEYKKPEYDKCYNCWQK